MLGLTTNHPQWSWLENRLTLGFANTLTFFKKWRVHVFLDHRGGNYMWNAGNYIRNKYDQNA